MSVAYYIVLDTDEPEFDTFVNGKYLAHEAGLDALCKQLHLKTFESYLAMSDDDISDMLGEDVDLPEGEGEQWFSAEEGLTWATTLAAYIKAHPSAVTEPQGCIDDLTEYADVFEKAKDIGAKWHLSLDI